MKILHPCYKSGVTQKFSFSSHRWHFMWFTFLCQSPEVEDRTIEIQKPGSSCVCKMDIEPTIVSNRFSRFLKNKVVLSYDTSIARFKFPEFNYLKGVEPTEWKIAQSWNRTMIIN